MSKQKLKNGDKVFVGPLTIKSVGPYYVVCEWLDGEDEKQFLFPRNMVKPIAPRGGGTTLAAHSRR